MLTFYNSVQNNGEVSPEKKNLIIRHDALSTTFERAEITSKLVNNSRIFVRVGGKTGQIWKLRYFFNTLLFVQLRIFCKLIVCVALYRKLLGCIHKAKGIPKLMACFYLQAQLSNCFSHSFACEQEKILFSNSCFRIFISKTGRR
jgi:hypothetical protein